MSPEPHFYEVDVHWSQDRKGLMCSPDVDETIGGQGCIEVATPPQFPKGIPGIWSPEHLFTASVNSCLMTTFLAIAENSGLLFKAFSCRGTGKLEQVDGKFVMSEVLLEPSLTLVDEKDRSKAERVLQKSEAACLISNSIKSKVVLKPVIVVEPAAVSH